MRPDAGTLTSSVQTATPRTQQHMYSTSYDSRNLTQLGLHSYIFGLGMHVAVKTLERWPCYSVPLLFCLASAVGRCRCASKHTCMTCLHSYRSCIVYITLSLCMVLSPVKQLVDRMSSTILLGPLYHLAWPADLRHRVLPDCYKQARQGEQR